MFYVVMSGSCLGLAPLYFVYECIIKLVSKQATVYTLLCLIMTMHINTGLMHFNKLLCKYVSK